MIALNYREELLALQTFLYRQMDQRHMAFYLYTLVYLGMVWAGEGAPWTYLTSGAQVPEQIEMRDLHADDTHKCCGLWARPHSMAIVTNVCVQDQGKHDIPIHKFLCEVPLSTVH